MNKGELSLGFSTASEFYCSWLLASKDHWPWLDLEEEKNHFMIRARQSHLLRLQPFSLSHYVGGYKFVRNIAATFVCF
jgi:hypothetical protein